MGMTDGECYTWAIQWPYAWHFHEWLEEHDLGTVPERFSTAEEAQRWIDWTYQQLVMLKKELDRRESKTKD
jgi:hypothetical protein